MASPVQHERWCSKQRGTYLAGKTCDSCGSSDALTVVYRKRWWVEVGVTRWAASKPNLKATLERSTTRCKPCIDGQLEAIRNVLNSGLHFDCCQESACPKPVAGRGFCVGHRYLYMRATGVQPRRMAPRGSGHLKDGYRVISAPGHPNADSRGLIQEHRKVMSELLGRPLRPGESVHHLNGMRDDNRPENLELWLVPQIPGQRVTDLVAWAREIIATYGEEATANAHL